MNREATLQPAGARCGARLGMQVCLVIACSGAATLGWGAPVRAQLQRGELTADARYLDLVQRGITETEARRWPEALALFKRAHEIKPTAKTLRAMGFVYFELRDYTVSVRLLREALERPEALSAEQTETARATLDQALAFTSMLSVDVEPEDAEVSIDGEPVTDRPVDVRVNVGTRRVGVYKEGYLPSERTVRVVGDEPASLRITLRPAPQAAGSTVMLRAPHQETARIPDVAPRDDDQGPFLALGLIFGGAALAASITNIVLWRISEDGPRERYYAAGCKDGYYRAAQQCRRYRDQISDLLAANIAVGVGTALFTATATTMFVVAAVKSQNDEPDAPSGGVTCMPGALGVQCRGWF